MRISAPLCAVALSLALTPPASSSFFATPAPADRAAYEWVQIPATAPEADKKGLADAIKTSCPNGQLATTKDDRDVYGVFWGFHRSIQLYCLGEDGKPGRELNRDMSEKGAYGIILYKGTEKEQYHLVYNGPKDKVWVAIADPAPFPPSTPKPPAQTKPVTKPVAKTEPPTVAADAPVKLSEADLNKLPQTDRDDYNKAWDEAKSDDAAKVVLNKNYSDKIAKIFIADPSGKESTTPTTPHPTPDLKNTTTSKQFLLLEPKEKIALCALSDGAGGSGGCVAPPVDAEQAAACMKLRGSDAAKKQQDCIAKIQVPSCKATTGATDRPSAEIASECAACKANGGCKNPVTPTNMTADVPTPGGTTKKDCPKTADGKSTSAPKDKEGCSDGKDKTDLTQFYGNLTNGMGFGVFGLVLGSFFGGPLVIAAFALAAGVGAYYMSKKINAPEKKDK